jgi:hypothetical protein
MESTLWLPAFFGLVLLCLTVLSIRYWGMGMPLWIRAGVLVLAAGSVFGLALGMVKWYRGLMAEAQREADGH